MTTVHACPPQNVPGTHADTDGSATIAASPSPAPEALPFSLQGNLVIVKGSINGSEADFLIDTGAGMSLLDSGFASRLTLKSADRIVGRGAGGDINVDLVRIDSLHIGAFERRNLSCGVTDLSGLHERLGGNIDGVIGFDIFGSGRLIVDYPQRRITFDVPPQDDANATSISGDTLNHSPTGLRLNRPNDSWKWNTETPLPSKIVTLEREGGASVSVHVNTLHGITLDLVAPSVEASLAAQVQDFALLGSEFIERGAQKRYRIDHTGRTDGKPSRGRTEVILEGPALHLISCTAPADRYDELARDFEAILDSVRFDAASSP